MNDHRSVDIQPNRISILIYFLNVVNRQQLQHANVNGEHLFHSFQPKDVEHKLKKHAIHLKIFVIINLLEKY